MAVAIETINQQMQPARLCETCQKNSYPGNPEGFCQFQSTIETLAHYPSLVTPAERTNYITALKAILSNEGFAKCPQVDGELGVLAKLISAIERLNRHFVPNNKT